MWSGVLILFFNCACCYCFSVLLKHIQSNQLCLYSPSPMKIYKKNIIVRDWFQRNVGITYSNFVIPETMLSATTIDLTA